MSRISLSWDAIRQPNGFTEVLNLVKNGIAITDSNSKIVYVNPSYTDITGYSQEDAIGNNPGLLRSGYHDENFYKAMWHELKHNGFWKGEIWNRNKSGDVYPSLLTISTLGESINKPEGYIAIFSDISFLKLSEKEKINLAFYDFLTKLPNRLYLEDYFRKITVNHNTGKINPEHKVALVFFDLNLFKQVNDKHGHVVGDKLLQGVAERLQGMLRDSEMLARYGGDEFVAVLSKIDNEDEVANFCTRADNAMSKQFDFQGIKIQPSLSYGFAIFKKDADTFETLISKADANMYEYKKEWKQQHGAITRG